MAIGMDRALPANNQPALKMPTTGPAPSYPGRAPAMDDRRVQAAKNNMAASSYGAAQLGRQEMDRAGVSRGRGHSYYGDVAQTQADAKASGAAAGVELEASMADAKARQDYDNQARSERTANQGLLANLRNAESGERRARRGMQQDIYEAMARGQFGLDSMNLDQSSLLDYLLR